MTHYLQILNGARAVTCVLLGVLTPTEPQPGNLCWVRVSGTCSGCTPCHHPHNSPTSTAAVMSNPTTVDNQQPYLAAFPQLLHNRGWNYDYELYIHISLISFVLLNSFKFIRGAISGPRSKRRDRSCYGW